MSNIEIISGVQGSDGEVPIHNPDALLTSRYLRDIFVPGGPGLGRVIPKVGELVFDSFNDSEYPIQVVTAIDYVSGKSTMKPWNNTPAQGFTPGDILTGVGNVTSAETYRIFLDTSVTPFSMTVDQRLSYPGPDVDHIVAYVGNPDGTRRPVSVYYNNAGELIGESVPVVPALTRNPDVPEGYTIVKGIPTFYSNEDLDNNTPVLVIAYAAAGHEVSRRQLLIKRSGFTPKRNDAIKYIRDISLRTPFMSDTDEEVINLPVNVPLQGLYMRGVVSFNDGSEIEYPIDNVRFSLLGLSDYVATEPNRRSKLVLRYRVPNNEMSLGGVQTDNFYRTRRYSVMTKEAQGAYNVKIYAYPVWIDPVQGYALRFFLYNSDRRVKYDITHLVEYAVNGAPFNPTLYGVLQTLNVGINLSKVSPSYVNYRFNQIIQLVLWREGTERETNWTIQFETGQDPAYGPNNRAKLKFINSNYYLLSLDNNCATMKDWLKRLYWDTLPIYNSRTEVAGIEPTHFRVKVGNQTHEYTVSEWKLVKQVMAGLKDNDTCFIEWIKKTPDSVLELGISGIPVYPDPSLVFTQ